MAKYFTYNNQYFTNEDGQIKSVNVNDIIGDAGDKPGGGTYTLQDLLTPNAYQWGRDSKGNPSPYIVPVDPSKFKIQTVNGQSYVDFGSSAPGLSTGGGKINQDVGQLLGLGGNLSSNQTAPYADFQNYLRSTGQSFNPQSGFSGNPNIGPQNLPDLAKQALDSMYAKGYTLNPNADLNNPKTLAEFTKIAEQEISPYYSSQFQLARESLLRNIGYSTDQLSQYESDLQRKYGQQVRSLQAGLAEQGFAQSGQRTLEEQGLAQDVQGQLNQTRQQAQFQAGTQARQFAQQYGGILGNAIPGAPTLAAAPRVLPGIGSFQSSTEQIPFYSLSNDVYNSLIGSEEFARRGAIASRTANLQEASNTLNAIPRQLIT